EEGGQGPRGGGAAAVAPVQVGGDGQAEGHGGCSGRVKPGPPPWSIPAAVEVNRPARPGGPRMALARPLAVVALLTIAGLAPAESPPSPLRLIPEQADLVVRVRQPGRLAETPPGVGASRRL